MRADPGLYNRTKSEGKRHLGSQSHQPSIYLRGREHRSARARCRPSPNLFILEFSESRGYRHSCTLPATPSEGDAGAGGPRVSWRWMTAHAGTCMRSRRNEPSGYELGNQHLANLAVWVELPSETFVCEETPLLFSLSCDVRHLLRVQGSLAV